ncbi:hypothetical protein EQG49_03210 [Periweissella cryptocerci]|uniref:MucBP domain-containing protein n=1 Tax=Periweissella cryptocerci TaxID=2506420 RepID=A0A4P6YS72_9LACO|nr:MucBP domain-containing protein [Periweissella cryptocerci]QBO35534.1 hypothetical protein EQG49_03210 [Periweissella cryptocerci]
MKTQKIISKVLLSAMLAGAFVGAPLQNGRILGQETAASAATKDIKVTDGAKLTDGTYFVSFSNYKNGTDDPSASMNKYLISPAKIEINGQSTKVTMLMTDDANKLLTHYTMGETKETQIEGVKTAVGFEITIPTTLLSKRIVTSMTYEMKPGTTHTPFADLQFDKFATYSMAFLKGVSGDEQSMASSFFDKGALVTPATEGGYNVSLTTDIDKGWFVDDEPIKLDIPGVPVTSTLNADGQQVLTWHADSMADLLKLQQMKMTINIDFGSPYHETYDVRLGMDYANVNVMIKGTDADKTDKLVYPNGKMITAPTYAHYKLQGNSTYTVAGSGDVTFTYVPNNYKLTVKYVDEKGKTIKSATTSTQQYKTTKKVSAPSIKGYAKPTTSNTVTFDGNKTVTFAYKAKSYKLTVKHVDKKTGKVIKTEKLTKKFGTKVNLGKKNLKGYKKTTKSYTVTGKQTITIKYAAKKYKKVTVKYVNQKGKQIAKSKKVTVAKNTKETFKPKKIKKYKTPKKKVVTIKNHKTIIFTYKHK